MSHEPGTARSHDVMVAAENITEDILENSTEKLLLWCEKMNVRPLYFSFRTYQASIPKIVQVSVRGIQEYYDEYY